MKRSPLIGKCGALTLAAVLILSGCGPQTADPSSATTTTSSASATTTSSVTEPTAAPISDDSLWFSEKAGVRGRIWLGMSVKEVYDVLVKYEIGIKTDSPRFSGEYGEAGILICSNAPFSKLIETNGHEFFEFDENDRLIEITYLDQLHNTDEPVNEEFLAEKGVRRRDSYERMVELYGQPDKRTEAGGIGGWSYVYRLENGNNVLFTFNSSDTSPLIAISYSLNDTLLF